MALTAKQEVFCQCVAIRKMNQSEAYSTAYDASKMTAKTISEAASRLAADSKVAARLQVLRDRAEAAAVKKAGFTLAEAIAEADELVADGKALGQVSAAVAASKLKATLAGHLTEKKDEKKNPLDDMEVTKLLAVRDEIDARLQREADALEMAGIKPTPEVVVPVRRVIG